MEVPRATERIRIGLPSTVTAPSMASTTGGGASSAMQVLEATQDFIGFLDALQLGLRAKDQLHPLLSDVIQAVNRVTTEDFAGRAKIVEWLIRLNKMKAADELEAAEMRDISLDMDGAYKGFKAALK
jgi:ESCRT-I complex subunit VPS28